MTDMIKNAAMGIKRMSVVICCVLSISAVEGYHTYSMEPIGAGTITAMTLIAALGGVDVWKNRKEQNV